VQRVGVGFGVPAPEPGDGQADRAAGGDHDHEDRQAADEPGWGAHVRVSRVGRAGDARRRRAAGGCGGQIAIRGPGVGDRQLRMTVKG
jgi:hypothetical protein